MIRVNTMVCGDGYERAEVTQPFNGLPVDLTANRAVLAAENGKLFTNKGAAGAVVATLPAPKKGMGFFFAKMTAQNFTVTATGGAKINGGGANGSYSNITGADAGKANVYVFSPDGVDWLIHGSVGTWATT
jgi:hypothetical protein